MADNLGAVPTVGIVGLVVCVLRAFVSSWLCSGAGLWRCVAGVRAGCVRPFFFAKIRTRASLQEHLYFSFSAAVTSVWLFGAGAERSQHERLSTRFHREVPVWGWGRELSTRAPPFPSSSQ